MKKLINTAFAYFVAAIGCGVLYREVTRLTGFEGKTALAFMHLHLFALGTLMFLILALFSAVTDLDKQKGFKRFYITYSIGLIFMVLMLGIRGASDVFQRDISPAVSGAISGISGIAHIVFTIALVQGFLCLKKINVKNESAKK